MAFKVKPKGVNYDENGQSPPDEADAAGQAGTGQSNAPSETMGDGAGSQAPNLPSTYGPNSPARKAKDADSAASFVVSPEPEDTSGEAEDKVFEAPWARGVGAPGSKMNVPPSRVKELKPQDDQA